MEVVNVALVGLGVIGGSFAKALKEQELVPVEVMGIDHNPETVSKALEDGMISKGEVENETILQEADLVIISIYPNDLLSFMEKHQADFKENAVITDTIGVKGSLVDQVQKYVRDDVEYLFGHPMAGRENKGYAYADASVFHGANYLLMPSEDNKEETLVAFEKLLKAVGFRRVSRVSPEYHDEMIAYTSQLCHVLAVALINSDEEGRDTANFVGDSYRELTRIAKINGDLWSQLFILNKEELLRSIDAFEDEISKVREAVAEENVEDLKELFAKSSQRRTALENVDVKINK